MSPSSAGSQRSPHGSGSGRLTIVRRVMRAIKRRVSRSQLVVPRKTIGSQECAARTGARWRLVERSAPFERRPPLKFGALPGAFEGTRLASRFPDMGVLELRDAFLVGPPRIGRDEGRIPPPGPLDVRGR